MAQRDGDFRQHAGKVEGQLVAQHGARAGRVAFADYETMLGNYHRSEEHTSELQSLMRISYAVFCLNKNNRNTLTTTHHNNNPQTHHNTTTKQPNRHTLQ